jgi:DNA (cytosine-5)-methyltransferase 1
MRFIELFAGVGGFRIGLERTGHKCVWANEWLEKPRGIYEYHFKEKPDGRDIRIVPIEDVPDADLIVGGFPCATFSVAGKRTGFGIEDTRGTLCFEMFRIASGRNIPYILFENVKGLLNHDNGRTLEIILCSLDELGYDCQWEVLDSQNFGVPQHRERLFLVGSLRGKPRPKVFPITEKHGEDDEENRGEQNKRQGLFSNISPTLDAHYYKGGAARQYVNQTGVQQYKSNRDATLIENIDTGEHNVTFVKPVLTPNRIDKRQRGRRFKEDGEPAFTLGVQDRHGVMIGQKSYDGGQSQVNDPEGVCQCLTALGGDGGGGTSNIPCVVGESIRKLTPLECERLQGLPDNWTKFRIYNGKIIENADSERYERCGRTVTIPVIEAIGNKLGRYWYED